MRPSSYSNTLILLGSKQAGGTVEQATGRKRKEIFLRGKVFNTSVDKIVEITRAVSAKFPLFNTLLRFAQFVCKPLSDARMYDGAKVFRARKNFPKKICGYIRKENLNR